MSSEWDPKRGIWDSERGRRGIERGSLGRFHFPFLSLLHPDFTGIGTMHCPALRSKHSNDLKLYQWWQCTTNWKIDAYCLFVHRNEQFEDFDHLPAPHLLERLAVLFIIVEFTRILRKGGVTGPILIHGSVGMPRAETFSNSNSLSQL